MVNFRLYRLNKRGRITERVDFYAEDDGSAIAFAAAEYPDNAWELWETARLVAQPAELQAAA